LGLLEPFARQYLFRKDMAESKRNILNGSANGHTAPNGTPANVHKPAIRISSKDVVNQRPKGMRRDTWKRERSTIRFAEQGWQFLYYIVYWPLGMVNTILLYFGRILIACSVCSLGSSKRAVQLRQLMA
jgi:acyl-CoA-dependent ceramide synthase